MSMEGYIWGHKRGARLGGPVGLHPVTPSLYLFLYSVYISISYIDIPPPKLGYNYKFNN